MASENTNTNSPQSASGPTNNTTVTIENQTSTNVENSNNNTSAATLGPEEEASKSQVRMPIIFISVQKMINRKRFSLEMVSYFKVFFS